MATQQQRITELAQAIAQDIKELKSTQGLLDSLSTTSKESLVDAINELHDALGNDANFAATLAEQMGKRVRVDESQMFTAAEQLTACTNIGIGDPDTDLLAVYTAAKV